MVNYVAAKSLSVLLRLATVDGSGHCDTAMQEVDPIESEPEPVEGDPDPCPEEEENFVRPHAGDMEEAIDKFLDGLDGQERSGFEEMRCFLATLPIP